MKLYRGIKAKEFMPFTDDYAEQLNETWTIILNERASGNFSYPEDLNDEILDAAELVRLQRQHFTDDKEIAQSYAEANNGILVEVDVPVSEILEHFTIEFQKFAQRRRAFELVYVVDAVKLTSFSKKWKLKAEEVS